MNQAPTENPKLAQKDCQGSSPKLPFSSSIPIPLNKTFLLKERKTWQHLNIELPFSGKMLSHYQLWSHTNIFWEISKMNDPSTQLSIEVDCTLYAFRPSKNFSSIIYSPCYRLLNFWRRQRSVSHLKFTELLHSWLFPKDKQVVRFIFKMNLGP